MMNAAIKQVKKNEKGFTLIELLAVVVILGIIAAIAIPMIGGIIKRSQTNADVATARQIYDATQLYITGELKGELGTTTTFKLSDLSSKGYIDSSIVLPSTKVTLSGANTVITYDATTEALSGVTLRDTTAAADATTGEHVKVYTAQQVINSEDKR